MTTQKKSVKGTDRRVERTQRSLRKALIELVNQHDWEAVSVQQVCERARVGRSTFYAHYADKEELLISGLRELKTALREHAARRGEPLGFTLALLEHTTEYQGVLRALTGTRTALVVQHEFTALVSELVEEDLAAYPLAANQREGAARYIAGAFCELLRWWGGWGGHRRRASSKDVDDLFRSLTLPMLSALRARGVNEGSHQRNPGNRR